MSSSFLSFDLCRKSLKITADLDSMTELLRKFVSEIHKNDSLDISTRQKKLSSRRLVSRLATSDFHFFKHQNSVKNDVSSFFYGKMSKDFFHKQFNLLQLNGRKTKKNCVKVTFKPLKIRKTKYVNLTTEENVFQ